MKFTEIIKNVETDLPKIKNPLWRYIMSYFFFAFISLFEILTSLGKFTIKLSLGIFKSIERITERFYNAK